MTEGTPVTLYTRRFWIWVAVIALAGALAGYWLAKRTILPLPPSTITEVRYVPDSSQVRILAGRLDSVKGKLLAAEARISQEERSTAAWKGRARQLRQLADSMMYSPRDTIEDIIAELDTTMLSPADRQGRTYTDTVGVTYSLARDLWLRVQLGIAPRMADFTRRDSTLHLNTVTNNIPWIWVGPMAAVVFVLGILVAK